MKESLKEMNVLIVEDRPELCFVFDEILREQVRRIYFSDGNDDILKIASDEKLDLVILDNKINGDLTGIEWLKILRKHFPEIVLIIITGFGDESFAVESLHSGADDYLTKPIRIEVVFESISRILSERKFKEELKNNLRLETLNGLIVAVNHNLNNSLGILDLKIEELENYFLLTKAHDHNYIINSLFFLKKELKEIELLIKKLQDIQIVEFDDYVNNIKMIRINGE